MGCFSKCWKCTQSHFVSNQALSPFRNDLLIPKWKKLKDENRPTTSRTLYALALLFFLYFFHCCKSKWKFYCWKLVSLVTLFPKYTSRATENYQAYTESKWKTFSCFFHFFHVHIEPNTNDNVVPGKNQRPRNRQRVQHVRNNKDPLTHPKTIAIKRWTYMRILHRPSWRAWTRDVRWLVGTVFVAFVVCLVTGCCGYALRNLK